MLPVQERIVRWLAGQTDHDQVVSWRWGGRSFRFTVPGDNVWICIKDDLLLREYEWMGTRLDTAIGIVVDAGAHVGTFAALASVNAQRVLALEPNPETVAQLQGNLDANDLDNVDVWAVGLWSDDRGRRIDVSGPTSAATIAQDHPAGHPVPTTTIDAVIAKTGPVDLFKMDIEGSEFAAVAAAADESLAQIREFVGELHLSDAAPGDLERFVERLESAGFTVEVRRGPIFHVRESLGLLWRHAGDLDGRLRLKLTLAFVYVVAAALDPFTGVRTRLAGRDLRLFRATRSDRA